MPTVVPGKLKLKGFNKKKKKKRTRNEREEEEEEERGEQHTSSSSSSSRTTTTKQETINPDDFLTETQRKFEQKKRKIDLAKAKEANNTTYRDRVEKFNYDLSIKSEHNDIPRISAAGNG